MEFDFTNEERSRIDQLYGNDFADVKPEDMGLVTRWERYVATSNEELQAKKNAIAAEIREKHEQSAQAAKEALRGLKELKAAALSRLERIDGEAD